MRHPKRSYSAGLRDPATGTNGGGQVRLPPSIGRTSGRRALCGLQSMCASKCWAVSCPSESWGAGPAVHLLTSPSVVPGPLTPGATSDAAEVIGLRGLLVGASSSAPSTTQRVRAHGEAGGRQDQPRLSLVVAKAGGGDGLWQGGRCQRTMSCAVPSPYPDVSTRVPPASPLLPAHACCHHGAHSPSEPPPSLSELQALSGGGGGRRDWPAVGLDSETSQPRFLPAQDIDDLHPEPCHPHLSPPPSQPLVSSLGWWELLGSHTQGTPALPAPILFTTPSSLSLTTFFSLRPHWPLVQPPLPQGPLRAVRWALRGSLPLHGSLPPGLGDSQMTGGGARSGATALGYHSLGSELLMAQMPGPCLSTQRREEAPCLCHRPRGRGPAATPPACARHSYSSSGGPFSRGSTPFRPTLLATGAPR